MHRDTELRQMVEQELSNEEEDSKLYLTSNSPVPRRKKKKKLSQRDREYKVYYKLINYVLISNSDEYTRQCHKATMR